MLHIYPDEVWLPGGDEFGDERAWDAMSVAQQYFAGVCLSIRKSFSVRFEIQSQRIDLYIELFLNLHLKLPGLVRTEARYGASVCSSFCSLYGVKFAILNSQNVLVKTEC